MRNTAFKEDRARDYQEIEELRRICCEETDKVRDLKLDELSTQPKESLSTVNQLLVQILYREHLTALAHGQCAFYT